MSETASNRLQRALDFCSKRKSDRTRTAVGAFIYVIQCERFVKIGVAVSVKQRLSALQGASPFKLTLLGSFWSADPYAEEGKIHTILDEYHVRGEWFDVPQPVLDKLFN